MKIVRVAIFLTMGAALLSGTLTNQSVLTSSKGEEQIEATEGEGDRILERIRLYLRRHGDNGRIDPEERLNAVRSEYRRRLEDGERGISPQAVQGSTWVSIGPTNGAGRMVSIVPHPTESGTLFAGAAGGGVWKTTDSGATWIPITDSIHDLSVGAIAVSPSNPNIIYVGTGEGSIAIDFIPGIGLIKSTDGGNTWSFPTNILSTRYYRVSVHPTNPNDVVVGVGGGGFRSTDGGANWTQVIGAPSRDVTDIVRHPTDPNILYAATWDGLAWCERGIANCNFQSPRVLRSTDGGATWRRRSQGLPVSTPVERVNRFSLAISRSNPSVLYVATSVQAAGAEISHIFKTTDGGDSWNDLPALSSNPNPAIRTYLGGQGWYDNTIVVSPTDQNSVFAGGVIYVRSTDGGNTWSLPPFRTGGMHVDAHDLQYQGTTLYIANDGGVWSTADNGENTINRNNGLVTRQYYGMANDPANPNRVFGGTQDNGTGRRPDSGSSAWADVLGGDGFECGVSPSVPSIAFATNQFGIINRTKNAGTAGSPRFVRIVPPYVGSETGSFLSLLTVDPSSPATIYTGTSRVWKSTNAGDTWVPLSTTISDGTPWPTNSISSIAVSRSNPSIIMVSKSPFVFRSVDGGGTWVNASSGLPASGINNVEIDPRNPNVAYAALAGTLGNRVFRTQNGGVSWEARAEGLPSFSAQVVRVDPTDSDVLYCGTDVGVFRSINRGGSWEKFGTGLPASSIHDIRIFEDGSMLRAATHGRGIWELQVPPNGNTVPTAEITSPDSMTIARGTTLMFEGAVTDADSGESVTGTWTFPDTWETVSNAGGQTSISHTFNVAGIYPVTLLARDARAAVSDASVTIIVTEPADDCATPILVPGSGPFPISLAMNNETGSLQLTDPQPICVTGNTGRTNSIWLEFTPTTSTEYEISTCGNTTDMVLSIWTGSACGPYTAVANACNDDTDSGPSCVGATAASVIINATAGQTYRIMAAGFNAAGIGAFTLNIRKPFGITSASVEGKKLFVTGSRFQAGAVVLLNGEQQKTRNDDTNPSTLLIAKKAGKRITPGVQVMLQVRNPDGSTTEEFPFTRAAAELVLSQSSSTARAGRAAGARRQAFRISTGQR